ncbi:hypothetical protein B0H66DRAFT_621021 [Apodospora peruviana]|uniref:Uncharacterized protein n=1 Tax=Apodospora peruviana TaxID=516989 RepID=A0AAE0IDH9_9PEZI|nr:hypothetical protein B0H66DRAFT_621021 [Apodospora peruviana]
MSYSPAQDMLEYETRTFQLGLGTDLTEYQGRPSPELDRQDHQQVGISLIPRSMAAQLPNKTVIFPHDKQRRYIIELDVFHQLHCLNMIRKALHPEYYKPHAAGPNPGDEDELLGPEHIDHCGDAMRQSLMCNSDVRVLVWTWNKEKQRNIEVGQIAHTRRRFDKIQAWARERAIYEGFDAAYRELNDPLDPDTWVDGFSA